MHLVGFTIGIILKIALLSYLIADRRRGLPSRDILSPLEEVNLLNDKVFACSEQGWCVYSLNKTAVRFA